MFFQVVLLAGYLYAHLLNRHLAPKRQFWVHAAVLLLAFTFLPLGIGTEAPMSDDRRKGSEVLIEVLRSEGVTHIFGNPGTTELPMIDALAAVSDIHYVLGLQESTVVGMADGYAQATGRPAFARAGPAIAA